MREIVLDTETTGLDALKGDRLIEIGCVEIVNRTPTGVEFLRFLNPEGRDVHPEAERVHGITTAFLQDKPKFSTEVDAFLEFIGDAPLVIHNAQFDAGFINMELERLGRQPIAQSRLIDTLALARRKHPAGPNTLDALCKRCGIDNSKRIKHGALMDSLLLASVYVELLGERQATLELAAQQSGGSVLAVRSGGKAKPRPQPLPVLLTEADEAAHRAFVESLGANAIWKRYLPQGQEGAG